MEKCLRIAEGTCKECSACVPNGVRYYLTGRK